VFISTWNLHRSAALWENPAKYDPERFLRPFSNPAVVGWAGYDPRVGGNGLYPNEIAADFAFLPFGGGQRKCVGDQFAVMEAAVTLALLLRRFDLQLAKTPEEIGKYRSFHAHERYFIHIIHKNALSCTY
jgi:cytochrome P450 family 97 subfamily B polypeptide 3